MTETKDRRASARSLIEAAAWRVHLTEKAHLPGESASFEAWLAADEANAMAWQSVSGPWDLLGEHATAPELMAARRAALSEAHEHSQRRSAGSAFAAVRVRLAWAAGVAAIAVLAGYLWFAMAPDVYHTAAGERRSLTLADGSVVALDAQTEVRVRYTDSGRSLDLVRGQAQFDVARDPERPFSVSAGGQKVIAVGTSFNVELVQSRLLVTLLQGRVVVVPKVPSVAAQFTNVRGKAAGWQTQAASDHVELVPGEQLAVGPAFAPSISAVDVDRATSWQTGRLVFEDEKLSDVAERLNRYNKHPVKIADAATAALRISGVLNTGDTEGFIATITTYFPVSSTRTPDGAIELRRR